MLTQSWAILFYLAEKSGKLVPRDPLARIRMMQWLMEGASDLGPTNTNTNFLSNRMPEKVPDSAIKFYEDRLIYLFDAANAQLTSTPYLAGNEITLADLAIYTIYAAAQGAARRRRSYECDRLGRQDHSAPRRAEGHEARKLSPRPHHSVITRRVARAAIGAHACAACSHGRPSRDRAIL
jgi:glutathione S-transferase